MIGRKVVEEAPITLPEAKQLMDKELKDNEEPIYEQTITGEYLKKFSKGTAKASRDMAAKLAETNERIKKEIVMKLVDLKPRDDEEIRAIFAKERYALTKEELKNLLDVVSGQK